MSGEPVGSVFLDVRAHGDKLISDIGNAAKKAADNAERSLGSKITGALTKAGKTGAKALAVGLAGATLAAGAFASSTLQIGVEYQNNLNTMQAVTHATAAQMQEASATARNLGNDLSLPATSAADAAAAMVELGKGGLSADQSMKAAKGTLTLAAAAQVDGATAAEIQSNALNAFSLSADKAGHVADVLANASNAASGEITDFAFGLQASSAVAAQFGLTVDDNVTALAEFANAGIKGSDAGTTLKSALLAMANPSDKAADALKTLGVDAFDANGNFVGLKQISSELADAHSRLSQEAFNAATAQAFGADAARAAGILAKNGAAGWDTMSEAISKSGGAADVAAAQMKGVGGAIQGFQSQIETVKIDAFNRAAPGLESFVRALSARLPAAADAGFAALDRLATFVQREMPKVRAVISEFAPVVQSQLTAKLELAADAARRVFVPAVRGAFDILRSTVQPLEETGRILNGVYRAGLDAAAKVAKALDQNSEGLGNTLRVLIGVVNEAGHVALPVLNVALQAGAEAAKVLIQGVAGIDDALGPLAGPVKATAAAILLGVAAVKALNLAFKGLTSARTQITKAFDSVSTAVNKTVTTVEANLAALNVVTTRSLNKGLTNSSSIAAKAVSGVGTAVRTLGSALPFVGIGITAIGAAMSQSAQSAQQAADGVQDLYGKLHEGGQAAADAANLLKIFQREADGGGFFADKFGAALSRGKAQADAYQRSLSVTDKQQQAVTQAQNDLTFAVQKYQLGSPQVVAASQRYQSALFTQKTTQDQLAQATKTTTQAIQDQTKTIQDAASADTQLQQGELSVKQAALDVATATKNATDAGKNYNKGSAEAQQAALALAQSQATLKSQILATADQARQAAIAHNSTKSAEDQAAAGNAAYRTELGKLAGTLAPGSAVRTQIDALIRQLDEAAKPRTAVVNVDVRGDSLSVGVGLNQTRARAGGGPMNAGEAYLTGEKGPELVIPRKDEFVIPTGLTTRFLRSLGRAEPTQATRSGVTLNIDVHPAPGMDEEMLAGAVARRIEAKLSLAGAR